jgi:GrpB-like predicted nucleotidyltransferase (UPF0157 family)
MPAYELRVREPRFREQRMLRTTARDVHIRVFSEGCVEIDRYLIFRDRLRQCTEDRGLYDRTKRRLPEQNWEDVNAYADAKADVIKQTLARSD